MHLASASKAPTLGLFSGSNIKKYEPYGNGSKALDTNILGISDFIKAISDILDK
ncbi:hypothetical protein [Priestia sp. SIMBA_032]|uniref:hypothetical protein n=1 Tax=Priestia sp. SIMBA_032 TaxID=3085775 RepID=UPI00397A8A74